MVLIPALNEGHSIAAQVREARRMCKKPVVVINDCSTDDTAAQAAAAGAVVLNLPVRLGAWGATQTGLRYAAKQGWPMAVTLDADGQHEARYIQGLTQGIRDGSADVVIGACPERASLLRRIAWRYLRWLAGIELADITSGFRAYGRAAIERLAQPDATLLDYQDVGVLMILQRHGLRIRELPVAMKPRLHGHSRVFDSWWTVAGYMAKTSLLCIARIGQGVPVLRQPPSPEC
jgi:glycosyltransferase involved in cell wall biosynthesis